MRFGRLVISLVAVGGLTLMSGWAPVRAQTGYGDDTVPPRSLSVDPGGRAETAGSGGDGGSNAGTIVAIVLAGGALLGAGLYIFMRKPGSER